MAFLGFSWGGYFDAEWEELRESAEGLFVMGGLKVVYYSFDALG